MKRFVRKMMSGFLGVFMGVAMLVGMLPMMGRKAKAAESGTTFKINDGDVIIKVKSNGTTVNGGAFEGDEIVIEGKINPYATYETTHVIIIDVEAHASVSVVLKNVNINASGSRNPAVLIQGVGDVTIILEGENKAKSGSGCAGIQKESTGDLIISAKDEADSLEATGGSGGAGIGGGSSYDATKITITGGMITANGGENGAGIGGGYDGKGTVINISGGTVIAQGGDSGAGIGGGNGGLGFGITIESKKDATAVTKVTAEGGENGAGIGGGDGRDGSDITINENTDVTATGGRYGSGIGGGKGGYGTGITITGGTVEATGEYYGAGIGGGCNGEGSYITITGGTVTATGGHCGAGIGGGYGGNGSEIIISGGNVSATAGQFGAGIGGGYEGDGSKITIEGNSDVTATGGNYGAGIGGGRRENDKGGIGSEITVSGGTVTATGGYSGAGIGGGGSGDGSSITIEGDANVTATGGYSGAGIGGGDFGNGSAITINGGTVTAEGGHGAAGIGGGKAKSGSNITISGGTVTSTGGGSGAGIGGGYKGDGTEIKISGGDVTATGEAGAGIGGGNEGDGSGITIIDGTVIAAAQYGGAGIGGGAPFADGEGGTGSNITISGGAVVKAAGGQRIIGVAAAIGQGANDINDGNESIITVIATIDKKDYTLSGQVLIFPAGTSAEAMKKGTVSGTQVTEAKITFDANGGSGTMEAATIIPGNKLPANEFTWKGYFFTGWNTADNGSGTSYGEGSVVNFIGSIMLYAQWKKSITGDGISVTVSSDVEYDGTAHTLEPVVEDGETTLTKGTDYTVTYEKNGSPVREIVDAGEYTVVITGKGNYTGQAEKTFTVYPKALKDYGDTVSTTFDGQVKVLNVRDAGRTLIEGKDYSITYKDSNGTSVEEILNTGEYTAYITGKGNYTGKKTSKITINPKPLTAEMVKPVQDVVYNGKVQTPVSSVNDGATVLTVDTDYTVTYKDSNGTPVQEVVDAGEYTVVITGEGNYTGEVEKTYTINKRPVTFTGKSATETFTGNEIEISNVKVSSGENAGLVSGHTKSGFSAKGTNVGVYSTAEDNLVILDGDTDVTANYDITLVSGMLEILPKAVEMNESDVVLVNAAFDGQDKTKQLVVKVVINGSEYTLEKDKDYTVSFCDSDGTQVSEIVEPGTYTVTISGIGNFSGTMTSSVTILPSSAKKYVVKFVDEDGTVLQSGEVAYGTLPEYNGADPTGATDVVCSAKWTGWAPAITNVTGDAIYKATYEKSGHTFDQEVVDEKCLKSAADCITAAVYYKSCKCGLKSTDEKDVFSYGEALGHDYKTVDGSAVAPTCTKAGKEADQKCSRCGDVVEGKVLHAKGHTFDQEVADAKYLKSAADCITAAVYYKSCKCGEKSTNEKDIFTYGEPAGHKWKAATGYAPKTCEVCGLEEGQKVTYDPITGQVFIWTKGSKEPFVLTIKRSQDDVNCFLHYLNTLLDGAEIKVEARSGSTIITIPAETLELLTVGDHLITVVFDDWKADFALSIAMPEATVTPVITPTDTPTSTPTFTPTPTPTPVAVDASPSTGDEMPVVPFALLMLAESVAAAGVVWKKRRNAA